MKRIMQRQGQLGPDGEPTRKEPTRPAQRPARERIGAGEYLRQVRAELRKVAWPTRAEVFRLSTIVLLAVVVLTGLIFLLDLAFGNAVIWLFE